MKFNVKTLFVAAAAVLAAASGQPVVAEVEQPKPTRPVDFAAQIIGGLAMLSQKKANKIDPELAALNDQLRCGELDRKQFEAAYAAWQTKQPSNSPYKLLSASNALNSALGYSSFTEQTPCPPKAKIS